MNATSATAFSPAVDGVFLALGQTLYACQLFEATMLEVLAAAHELLDGSGDGTKVEASIETLSRKTLGQLLHDMRKRADIRADADDLLNEALEARNHVVHRFAENLGDDLTEESKLHALKRSLYEKCAIVMNANTTALAVLDAIGHLNSERSTRIINEHEQVAAALQELMAEYSKPRH